MNDLDARLLAAHEVGDKRVLSALYAEAAAAAETEDARGFYLTQAYIFALDAGGAEAETFRDALRQMGLER